MLSPFPSLKNIYKVFYLKHFKTCSVYIRVAVSFLPVDLWKRWQEVYHETSVCLHVKCTPQSYRDKSR